MKLAFLLTCLAFYMTKEACLVDASVTLCGQIVDIDATLLECPKTFQSLESEVGLLGSLETLRMYARVQSLPTEIGNLFALQEITLHGGNTFTTLPSELGRLTNLTHLSFSLGRISVVPSQIGKLQKLRFISMRSNRLTAIPPVFLQLASLESLVLNSNQFASLPTDITRMSKLSVLSLDNTNLPQSGLPFELVHLTSLQVIYLRGTGITALPDVFVPPLRVYPLDILSRLRFVSEAEFAHILLHDSVKEVEDVVTGNAANLAKVDANLTDLEAMSRSTDETVTELIAKGINTDADVAALKALVLDMNISELRTTLEELQNIATVMDVQKAVSEIESAASTADMAILVATGSIALAIAVTLAFLVVFVRVGRRSKVESLQVSEEEGELDGVGVKNQ